MIVLLAQSCYESELRTHRKAASWRFLYPYKRHFWLESYPVGWEQGRCLTTLFSFVERGGGDDRSEYGGEGTVRTENKIFRRAKKGERMNLWRQREKD